MSYAFGTKTPAGLAGSRAFLSDMRFDSILSWLDEVVEPFVWPAQGPPLADMEFGAFKGDQACEDTTGYSLLVDPLWLLKDSGCHQLPELEGEEAIEPASPWVAPLRVQKDRGQHQMPARLQETPGSLEVPGCLLRVPSCPSSGGFRSTAAVRGLSSSIWDFTRDQLSRSSSQASSQ